MTAASYQGLRETCKQQKVQISLHIHAVLLTPTRLLAIETCYMQKMKIKNIIPLPDMHGRIQRSPTGYGVELLLEGGSYLFFFLELNDNL